MTRPRETITGKTPRFRRSASSSCVRAVIASCYLLLASAAARADWTLVTADFAEKKGLTVNTWDSTVDGEGLSLTGESGRLLKVPTRHVISLVAEGRNGSPDSPGPAGSPGASGAGPNDAWRLVLRNGDVLLGDPAGIMGQSLLFKTRDLGTVTIPLKMAASLGAIRPGAAPRETPSAPDKDGADRVRLGNGDSLDGLVVNVDAGKLQVATNLAAAPAGGGNDNATTDIDMANVRAIDFGGTTPPRTIPPLAVRITFVGGSIMTVPLAGSNAPENAFSWTINDVTIKDSSGSHHQLKADQIARVDVVGGRVVYLTELDPTKEEQVSFLGTHWPMQTGRNAVGLPLRVARITYSRGLGVHTKSVLTYDLGGGGPAGGFDALRIRVGVDDSAAPRGRADVSILLDGKMLWEHKDLKAGELSELLTLPVSGGRVLELRAEPPADAAGLDVQGRVDWLDTALVRK